MATEDSPPARAALPRGLLIVGGLACATIAIAGFRASAGILGPTFLALVLVVHVHPARHRLSSKDPAPVASPAAAPARKSRVGSVGRR